MAIKLPARLGALNARSIPDDGGSAGLRSARRGRAAYLVLQAASACSRAGPAGTAEVLMTSSHTSRAAAFTALVSPLAALTQTASSLVLAPAGSVLCAWMACLQAATAVCTLAPPAGLLEVAAGVEEVVAAAAGG